MHRDDDLRTCGAKTDATGQSTVFVNGKLVAVEDDQCDHGGGDLVSSGAGTIRVAGKKVIVVSDTAQADLLLHLPPATDPSQGSPNVNAY